SVGPVVDFLTESIEHVLSHGLGNFHVGGTRPPATVPPSPAKPGTPDEMILQVVVGDCLGQPRVSEGVAGNVRVRLARGGCRLEIVNGATGCEVVVRALHLRAVDPRRDDKVRDLLDAFGLHQLPSLVMARARLDCWWRQRRSRSPQSGPSRSRSPSRRE